MQHYQVYHPGRLQGKSLMNKIFWYQLMIEKFFDDLLLLSLGYISIPRPPTFIIDEVDTI